jgi:hypothetical protein
LTPTVPATPQIGIWVGSTPFGGSVFFEVTEDNKVQNFSLQIPLGANRCTLTPDGEIVIEPDGSFIIGSMDSEGELEINGIRGKFDTPTSITGAYSSALFCGNTAFASSAEGSWSASWREQ